MRRENKIMTIKEKLETIKGKKIAIQCLNEWQARVIHKYLDNNNISCYWDNYGSHTCYDYQTRMMFADKEWFNGEGYTIYSFCDFMEGIDLANALDFELSEWEVNAILDEKYGKGNWVIK